MKKAMIVFTSLIILASCSNSELYQKIPGEWKCSSWIVTSNGKDKCQNNVRFEFKADKTYTSVLGSARDTGTYSILSDMLYVTPDGKMEFGVQINKLTADTLEFLMNQAGEEEILTLVKTQ